MGSPGYVGAAPTDGPAHRYLITVFALGQKLELDKNATPAYVGFNMHFATLSKASLVVYGKKIGLVEHSSTRTNLFPGTFLSCNCFDVPVCIHYEKDHPSLIGSRDFSICGHAVYWAKTGKSTGFARFYGAWPGQGNFGEIMLRLPLQPDQSALV
ncbi:hypothetical protein LZD49_34175 [Dyadobacter sp. CY261]|nr:hypothetical protein [Dyadobacter sp. CY261]MCF0075571.1 hypothetical protein [Dyadobacter sp. CY261]